MARASAAAENAALDGLDATSASNVIPYMSLHTGDPGETGTTEYAGVTRQSVSWNAASSSAKTNSGSLAFTTSGASEVSYFGLWSAVSSGTYALGGALTTPVTAVNITFAAGAVSLGIS